MSNHECGSRLSLEHDPGVEGAHRDLGAQSPPAVIEPSALNEQSVRHHIPAAGGVPRDRHFVPHGLPQRNSRQHRLPPPVSDLGPLVHHALRDALNPRPRLTDAEHGAVCQGVEVGVDRSHGKVEGSGGGSDKGPGRREGPWETLGGPGGPARLGEAHQEAITVLVRLSLIRHGCPVPVHRPKGRSLSRGGPPVGSTRGLHIAGCPQAVVDDELPRRGLASPRQPCGLGRQRDRPYGVREGHGHVGIDHARHHDVPQVKLTDPDVAGGRDRGGVADRLPELGLILCVERRRAVHLRPHVVAIVTVGEQRHAEPEPHPPKIGHQPHHLALSDQVLPPPDPPEPSAHVGVHVDVDVARLH
eukprot:m.421145 g.421145  ORF g.421145 m.421145 type:complete len:358 (+) comp33527_c0_seq1:266-1339(+)